MAPHMGSRARITTLALAMSALAALPLSGCGQAHGANGAMALPPPVVGVVTVEPQPVALTTELPGRTSPYRDLRGAPAGRRRHQGAAVHRGLRRPGRPAALPDRPGALSGRLRPAPPPQLAKAEANLATVQAEGRALRRPGQDQRRQQAGRRRRRGRLPAGRGRPWQQAKAALEAAQINLDYTRVTAPISGRIGRSAVTPGRAGHRRARPTPWPPSSARPDLCRRHPVGRRAAAPAARQIAGGAIDGAGADRAEVQLILEDGTAYPLDGELQFADVTVDQTTGAVTLRAVFPNPNGVLLPGMYVRAVVDRGRRPRRRSWRRSRASPATRRASRPRWWSTPTGKVELRMLQTAQRSATSGWSPRA